MNFTVVLVEPSHPGNVGSVARAMNNMGFSHLRLVNPCDHLHKDALAFAANSREILQNAEIYSSLPDAIADQKLIIGTSTRQRGRHVQISSLWDLKDLLSQYSEDTPSAVIFGRERVGLTNEEMDACNEWVYIPTFGASKSLNLAQAVVVFLYELSKTNASPQPNLQEKISFPIASSKNIEGLKHHLFEVLDHVRFLKEKNKPTMWSSFSDMISRAKPSENDVRIIRGFLNRIEISLKLKSTRKK